MVEVCSNSGLDSTCPRWSRVQRILIEPRLGDADPSDALVAHVDLAKDPEHYQAKRFWQRNSPTATRQA